MVTCQFFISLYLGKTLLLKKPTNMLQSLPSSFDFAELQNWVQRLRLGSMLTSQSASKLSQEQLSQLQKDTHFDKKELQQWYRGWSAVSRMLLLYRKLTMVCISRISQRLSERHAHERGVSKDIQAILPLW